MADGFAFENCLLKHYIRKEVWLPKCKRRLNVIKHAAGKKQARRLRYFTFCAVGALDVLLLDREKILKRSANKEFDTVYFFDRDEDAVAETRKRIPGANGFPGDFVKVLLETPDGAGLASPTQNKNTREVREEQQNQAQRQKFISAFPFDVLNLDVEQYLFKPKEELPGKLVSALRALFDLQKKSGIGNDGKKYLVDEFTLMFTTQVGPSNLPESYISYLRDTCLQQNIARHPELAEPFAGWSQGKNLAEFFQQDFDAAFRLAVPKSLIELALECDWHIEGEEGVEAYQFERAFKDGNYKMLHFAMTVRRQSPPKENRSPGQATPLEAQTETKKAIVRLFKKATTAVETLVTGDFKDQLKADLDGLFEHRAKYYKPPE
jgi:hypothetical protein